MKLTGDKEVLDMVLNTSAIIFSYLIHILWIMRANRERQQPIFIRSILNSLTWIFELGQRDF
jgi:hypothetical protein